MGMDTGKVLAFHTHKAQSLTFIMTYSHCPFASLQARDGNCRQEEDGTAGLGFSLEFLIFFYSPALFWITSS